MTTTETIASARLEVTFGSGRKAVIDLESIDGLPITGHINTETEAIEDGPASWEAGYVIRRPGITTADIALKGKVLSSKSHAAPAVQPHRCAEPTEDRTCPTCLN